MDMNTEAVIKEAIRDAFQPLAELETLKALEYLTPSEVERLFPLPVSTLQKMRKAGSGPQYIKRGKNIYYKPQAIRAYLDSRQQMTSLY